MSQFSINRRFLLQLLASSAALPLVGGVAPAFAQQSGVRVLVLSDLHSAYERMGQLLAALETQVATAGAPHLIAINGDVFEQGNVVAKRSGGEIDWAFLGALAKLAPTVVNIGNHESDLDNDLANFVAKAGGLGITVLSNIVDTRTGAPYAKAGATLDIGGVGVSIAALATDAINTYPKPSREQLSIPKPVEWAKENLPARLGDAGRINIVLSHAGVVADRDILPLLPQGTLLVGGHDHLRFIHEEGATRYVHTGSWSSAFTIATIAAPGAAADLAQVDVDRNAPMSATLAALIPAVLAKHLTAEELASIGTLEKPMTLGEAARYVATTMADITEGDIGFIGHTTFGTGLAAGPISRFDFNASLRFDGKLVAAEVDAPTLAAILERCNQDGDIALSARTGDFLYAAPVGLAGKPLYRIVTNDWSATNQKSYFGREDLVFTEIGGDSLKTRIEASFKA